MDLHDFSNGALKGVKLDKIPFKFNHTQNKKRILDSGNDSRIYKFPKK
jgi:hypothetical protein